MVIALLSALGDYPTLFQQVIRDLRAVNVVVLVKENLDEFSESRRIQVPDGLRVSEGLKDRVGVQDSLFYILGVMLSCTSWEVECYWRFAM